MYSCSGSLEAHRFYRRLISLWLESAHLIPWCCKLGYMLIICLFLLVSTLTFYQSRSLRDANVVFYSTMIFFINSIFILSSCVKVCFVVLFCVVFRFLLFCVSVRWGFFSCFSALSVSVHCWYWSLFTNWYVSSILYLLVCIIIIITIILLMIYLHQLTLVVFRRILSDSSFI